MPWKVENVMDLRIEFVLRAARDDMSFSGLCKEFGISRPTGYLWMDRYKESGTVTALAEKSRQPHSSPKKTALSMETLVVDLRKQHGWGARKIQVLLAKQGLSLPEVTINRIIKRYGLVDKEQATRLATKRFERDECNQMMQMDFKGEYKIDVGWCFPLSLIDDASRYLVGLWPLSSTRAGPVKTCLESMFRDAGMPKSLLMDHGIPWWNASNGHGLTWLSVWLIKHDIKLIYSGIRHPQTQGKVERFHRTLSDRTEHEGRPKSLEEWNVWASVFREEYNNVRPHESLEMRTPGEVYNSANLKPYVENPEEWDYSGARVRVLNSRGCLGYEGKKYFICEALAGERVRVDALEDTLVVTFRSTTIKEVDMKTGRSKTVILPARTYGLDKV